jgi:hypothetical protein
MADRGALILDCGRISWRRDVLPAAAAMVVTAVIAIIVGMLIFRGYAAEVVAIVIGSMVLLFLVMSLWLFRRRVRVWERGLESQAGFHEWRRITFVELYGGEWISIVTQRPMSRWGMFDEAFESRVPRDTYSELARTLERLLPGRLRVRP